MIKPKSITQELSSNLIESDFLNSPLRKKLNNYIEKLIKERLKDSVFLKQTLYHFGIHSSGNIESIAHSKRLRGLLFLTIVEGLGGDVDNALPFAAAIEISHNTSLLVDDIQDDSSDRCGKKALWKVIGIGSAINHAFVLKDIAITSIPTSHPIYQTYLQTLLKTSQTMAEGQEMDINAEKHWEGGVKSYMEIISKKTASLIASTCYLAATYCESDLAKDYQNFGESFGLAHQLEDDIDDLAFLYEKAEKPQIDSGNLVNFLNKSSEGIMSIIDIRKGRQKLVYSALSKLTDLKVGSYEKIHQVVQVLLNRNNQLVMNILNTEGKFDESK